MYHALYTNKKGLPSALLMYNVFPVSLATWNVWGLFTTGNRWVYPPLLSEVYEHNYDRYLMDRVFQFYPSLHEPSLYGWHLFFWLTSRFLGDVSLYFHYVSFLYFCTLRRLFRCVCSHHVLCVKQLFIYIVWPPVDLWACIKVNSLHNHLFHNSEIRNWIFFST